MRFGLVGTGFWARTAHATALAQVPGISLAAVWGRNPQAAASLAADFGATAYRDVGAFIDAVDAVAFAVPPDVQAPIAIQAAEAGKHLLLEKPIATSTAEADKMAAAAESAGATGNSLFVWGEAGRSAMPATQVDAVPALRTAASELAAAAAAGRSRHPCDVQFGRDVVRVLAAAQAQVDAARPGLDDPPRL